MTTRMASTTGSTTERRETGNDGMKHLQKRVHTCIVRQYLNENNYYAVSDRPTLYVYRHIVKSHIHVVPLCLCVCALTGLH